MAGLLTEKSFSLVPDFSAFINIARLFGVGNFLSIAIG